MCVRAQQKHFLTNVLTGTTEAFPYQCAYRHSRSAEDATLTLLYHAYTYIEKLGLFVRILFIDFSSAFNTIQPHLMAHELLNLDVNPKLIVRIVDFLVNSSQTIRDQAALSFSRSISTGSPQGTILYPILFTLYTNDCIGTDTTPVIKHSDDTAIEDLSNSYILLRLKDSVPGIKITGLI